MDLRVTPNFSDTYQEARDKFLTAAQQRGARLEEHVLSGHLGLHGETLATDVALWGSPDADKLMLITSAIHGVEGYCGSGCQISFLQDDSLFGRAEDLGVAIAFVHAVNPHGFSFGRRVNEVNVDVNRNFMSFDGDRPGHPAYAELDLLVLPETWPPEQQTEAELSRRVEAMGASAYGQTLFRGQYEFPNGMFFGGTSPTWSNNMVRNFLRTHASKAQQIGWIDLHTGLGPRGNCEKVFIGKQEEFVIAQRWWGNDVISPVRADSVMFEINGPMLRALQEECPQAQAATIALEFGTVPLMQMLNALRADHWCWAHDEPQNTARRVAARQALRDAFFVADEDWYGMVVGQFKTAAIQCMLGLGAEEVSGLKRRAA